MDVIKIHRLGPPQLMILPIAELTHRNASADNVVSAMSIQVPVSCLLLFLRIKIQAMKAGPSEDGECKVHHCASMKIPSRER